METHTHPSHDEGNNQNNIVLNVNSDHRLCEYCELTMSGADSMVSNESNCHQHCFKCNLVTNHISEAYVNNVSRAYHYNCSTCSYWRTYMGDGKPITLWDEQVY